MTKKEFLLISGKKISTQHFLNKFYKKKYKFGFTQILKEQESLLFTNIKTQKNFFSLKKKKGKQSIYLSGHIYNKKELSNLLKKEGEKEQSIKEILLRLYIIHGKSIISKINGIFSLVIIDHDKKEVIITRDRFGGKNIYYNIFEKKISISDDFFMIKKQIPHKKLTLDIQALSAIILCRFVPGHKTIFEEINKVEPAEIISFNYKKGYLKKTKYWFPSNKKLKFSQKEFNKKYSDLIYYIKESLGEMSILLSGGIDSASLMVALDKQNYKPKAYTGVFQEAGNTKSNNGLSINIYDESNKAFKVASHYKTTCHKIYLNSNISLSEFEKLQKILGEPICVSNSLGLYLLSKKLEKKVKTVISGTGADELLGGYKELYYGNNYKYDEKIATLDMLNAFSDFDKSGYDLISLLKEEFVDTRYLYKFIQNTFSNIHSKGEIDLLNQLTIFELSFGLPNRELIMAEKIFKNTNIDSIPGFLENNFLNYSLTIESEHKKNKKPLRNYIKNQLPNDIVEQKKIPSLNTPLEFFKSEAFLKKINDIHLNPIPIWNKHNLQGFLKDSYKKKKLDVLYRVVYLDSRLRIFFYKSP